MKHDRLFYKLHYRQDKKRIDYKREIQVLYQNFIQSQSERDFIVFYNRLQWNLKYYIYLKLKKYNFKSFIFSKTKEEYNIEYISILTYLLDEIFQQTWLRIFTTLDSYEDAWKISTWIYSIVRNEIKTSYNSLNRIKKLKVKYHFFNQNTTCISKKIKDVDGVVKVNKILLEEVDNSNEYYQKMIEEDFYLQQYENKINELPEQYKYILYDRDVHHLSYEDIANKYQLKIQDVKNKIYLGRKRAKEELKSIEPNRLDGLF